MSFGYRNTVARFCTENCANIWVQCYRSGKAEGEQDLEGHLQADHVHMLVSIPPKYSVAQVVGFIKGKSAIHLARSYLGRRKNYTGMHFWARGYFVSTVGADEERSAQYIQKQEKEDARIDQLGLFSED